MEEEENSRYAMAALPHLYTFLCSCTVQRDSGKYTVSLHQSCFARLLFKDRPPASLGNRDCSLSSSHIDRYRKYGPSLGTVTVMRDALLRASRQQDPNGVKKGTAGLQRYEQVTRTYLGMTGLNT